jgi:uncharacterized phage protein (TIGR01671 family)
MEYSRDSQVWAILRDPQPNVMMMQFTGLRDKDGKEIYEGDIIDITGRMDDYQIIASVVWNDDELYWGYEKRDFPDIEVGNLADLFDSHTEIIGNIYENGELTL